MQSVEVYKKVASCPSLHTCKIVLGGLPKNREVRTSHLVVIRKGELNQRCNYSVGHIEREVGGGDNEEP